MATPAAPIPLISPQPAIQPEVSSPVESQSRHWPLWLFGGVALLALGVAAGVLSVKLSNQPSTQPPGNFLPASNSESAKPTPLPSEASAGVDDPTADWKTYTNSQMGFSLKHPIEYFEEEVTDLGPYDKRIVFKSQENKISSFSISTSPAKLPQYPYDQKPNGDYSLDGYRGVYLELPKGYADAGESSPPPLLALYIQKGEILYQIKFFGVSGLSDVLVTQILSTFHFLK